MTNNNDKEKEYEQLEKDLEELAEDILPDSISEHNCEECGTRLYTREEEQFSGLCEECAWNQTSGLIDDDEEEEL